MVEKYRHIDTTGLPDKFDIADLVESGVVGDELIEWCKARVRSGPPSMTKAEMRASKPAKPVVMAERKAAPVNRPRNVVPIPEPEPAPQLDIPPEFSEDSLADDFTRRHHKTMAYCASWESWLHWDENRWNKDDTHLAVDLARRVCRDAALLALDRLDLGAKAKTIANSISSRRCFGAVEGIARSDRRHVVRPSQFDADPWIINTPDGVVDLTNGKMRKARRNDWCIKTTKVGPSSKGCPIWQEFLQDCTQGDTAMQGYLKRIAGYCLTGSIAEQKFFFIYGGGGNGKGVFLNTLMWILDSYGRQANMDTFTESKFTKHASEIAFFQGARLVVASETNVGQRWNEARIKGMTGGDPITANHMRKDPFTFLPNFKLLFTGNHKPHLKNVDVAIKRRLFLLPFDYDVPDDKIDESLPGRLQDEAAGILAWAIEGCMEWQETRLNPPARVIATTMEYFESEDKIGAFLEDCCRLSTSEYISTTRLFERYVKWSDGQGTYSGGRPGFLDMMAVKGFKSERFGGEYIIRGVNIDYKDQDRYDF
jgi:putative DNA primase/helicase